MKHDRTLRMSLVLTVALLAGLTIFSQAQSDAPPPPQAPATMLDETDLEQLVAPIALYPDPLLAEVLPAATYPSEIQSALAWLQANPNPTEAIIAAQPYDPPILAMMHYPTVLQLLGDQIDWTQQLGTAFLNQPADVMNAVQQLRQRAINSGALVNGPQVQVYNDSDGIQIVPANPNTISVPEYDPDSLYVGDGGAPLIINYGPVYPCGVWLDFNFDWHNHWVGRGRGWNHGWPKPVRGRGPVMHPWVRNNARPLPVVRPGARGYANPRAGRPVPPAFDAGQRRADVQRQDERARNHQPARVPAQRPAPSPRPHETPRPAPAPRQAPEPRPAQPAPRQAPEPRPAPAPRQQPVQQPSPPPAFHPDNNAPAQSNRGHASQGGGGGGNQGGGGGNRGGGGGGGARGGGGGGRR